MQIFKPTPYSTTQAFADKLRSLITPRGRAVSGLGTTLSMSNDMMLGMALGGVAYLVMKKKGMLGGKRASA